MWHEAPDSALFADADGATADVAVDDIGDARDAPDQTAPCEERPSMPVEMFSHQSYTYVRTSAGCVWRRRNDGPRAFAVLAGLRDVVSSSAGMHGLAVVGDGTARRYPDPAVPNQNPVPIPAARTVAASISGMCAIVLGDTVQCTGAFGEQEPRRRIFTPTGVPGVRDVAEIGTSQGTLHLALLRDGSVTAWTDPFAPTSLPNLAGAQQVGGSLYATCFIMRDRTVRCAGENRSYFCGTREGAYWPIHLAREIGGLADIVQVAAGHRSTAYALRADGRLMRWGKVQESTTVLPVYSPTPELVPELSDVVRIGGGEDDLLALRRDGTLWSIHLPTEDGLPRLERVPGFGPTP